MAKKPHRTDDADDDGALPGADQSTQGTSSVPPPDDDGSQGDASTASTPPPAPTQAEKDADKEPLDSQQAEQLMRAGHRLRIKGEPPSNWICMTRHSGDLAISYAATDDNIKEALGHDLLLADD
jgi:hypothetical protein